MDFLVVSDAVKHVQACLDVLINSKGDYRGVAGTEENGEGNG